MNPTDLSNALLYGIPIVVCTGVHRRLESLITQRGRIRDKSHETTATREPDDTSESVQTPSLSISVAESPEQIQAARELVNRRYAWRGYSIGAVDSAQLAPVPHEITFVALAGPATVGTLTLGLDGPKGLLAEETHDLVIDCVRAAGRRVCELTRLAIAENVDSKPVLASLFSLAHAVGRTMHDVTDVFIEVNPRHVGFYSRVLGFAVAAGEKVCARVRAPSVLLQLELEALEQRLKLLGSDFVLQPMFAKAA